MRLTIISIAGAPTRASRVSGPAVMPCSGTSLMQLDHMTIDTSHGGWRRPAVAPWLVVRWGIRRSNSLSNSIVNAISAWESELETGKRSAIA
jgi:hypothetical protein